VADDLRCESNQHKYNDGQHYALGLVCRLHRSLLDAGTTATAETRATEAQAADDHNDNYHKAEQDADRQTDVVR